MVLKSSSSLDYWRNYFLTANSDIFTVIEQAILVAASDSPKEFRLRRDGIAERLFSSLLSRCSGCERPELAGEEENDGHIAGESEFDRDGFEFEARGSKESNVYSSRGEQRALIMKQVNNYSYGEAEALTDEIEEESQNFEEIMRIKQIFQNKSEESDSSAILDSLRRLQLMALTVDNLKATEIGKAVNAMRKHGSKQISRLAQALINEWKELVDDWYRAASDAKVICAEDTPDSKNPSMVDDEVGLPSPPMDDAVFSTQPITMELSQFFDGMDDDGNPQIGGEFIKSRSIGRKPPMEDHIVKRQKPQVPISKPMNTIADHERLEKRNLDRKLSNETKFEQKTERPAIRKTPIVSQIDKSRCSDEMSVQTKLEATKRKLQESYQQAENVKKQRTIQVMEMCDLPKQGLSHRGPHVKPGSHNWHRPHGKKS